MFAPINSTFFVDQLCRLLNGADTFRYYEEGG